MKICIKSVYAPPEECDGFRVLMDRYWPRGMTRRRAALDDWRRELAPSPDLAAMVRDGGDFELFTQAYLRQLAESDAGRDLLDIAGEQETITVVYAASDPQRNHAVVLQRHLEDLVEQRIRAI